MWLCGSKKFFRPRCSFSCDLITQIFPLAAGSAAGGCQSCGGCCFSRSSDLFFRFIGQPVEQIEALDEILAESVVNAEVLPGGGVHAAAIWRG